MTGQWSLDYERLDELIAVRPVDEQAIEQTLQRIDWTEVTRCGLTNVAHHCWLICRGDRDKHLVEYVSSPLTHYGDTGIVASRIFILARKKPSDCRALRIRWHSHPDVPVDVRADSVLQLSEVLAIFTTFFRTNRIHHDFATIPKFPNGYL